MNKLKSIFKRAITSVLAISCCTGLCVSQAACGSDMFFDPTAEIVNKDGATAVVTFVVDDGDKTTATFARNMMDEYDSLTFSFAVWTKDFATLVESDDGSDYVKLGNNYLYTQNATQLENVAFWNDILESDKCELISHTHTHAFWGTNDDGGTFEYVKNNDTSVLTATMPAGSVSKEIYASNQILKRLFPSDTYLNQKCLTFVIPGIGVRTSDYTTSDGRVIKTYNTYFTKLLKQAIKDGEYISARNTFQVVNTSDSSSKVNLPSTLDTIEKRMSVNAYMIVNANKGSNIDNWTAYIDHAISQNGWACYCIHKMINEENGHFIYQDDAEALFDYAASKNVWIATYSDASLYYLEWSSAAVNCSYKDGKITVTVKDKENDDIFDMPLTVKVTVPSDWTSASVGGETIIVNTDSNGNKFVYVNAVPDGASVIIEKN